MLQLISQEQLLWLYAADLGNNSGSLQHVSQETVLLS